jgi:hypothetical protein
MVVIFEPIQVQRAMYFCPEAWYGTLNPMVVVARLRVCL